MVKQSRGGARANAGRPTIANKALNRTVRLADDDWAKFKKIGGTKWLKFILSNAG